MDLKTNASDRKIARAVVAGLVVPGLGQIYNGELMKGICFFCLFIMSPLILLSLTLHLPDTMLMAGTIVSAVLILVLYVLMAAEAWGTAARAGKGYELKKYNRWYFYLTFGLFGSIFISGSVLTHTQNHIMGFYRIVSASMEPAVSKGDFIIFDMTAYKHETPKKGDIVVFTYPDDRSKLYCKRIGGMAGDTMKTDSNVVSVVPHGTVFVLGDNRGHSDDSRHYGPIPLTEIRGKGRQIYLSFSFDKGIRWNRIGMTLP